MHLIWRYLKILVETMWRVNKEGVPYKYPWLLFRQGGEKGARYNLYDPVTNLTYSINIPEFEGCEIRFSNKGWLLVTKSPTSVVFFQPFTRTRIQVPDLRQIEAFAFRVQCTPTSPNRKIFGIRHLQLRVINVGIWVKVTRTGL
ncbi:hypothetical protein ES332_A05G056200v1 [Gossypium tomentosum]|uniref:KIB1-4 beta-propeller domain-containing protein n=1 Tax=Gossypium tomentosum TaxID=34277 RepID=A0A5D2QAK4_GOSTO|nr:hypothetical protein ES332_A05G056200v1 [Gossypium tomentosum]